jgi:hypothetical protein
MQANRGSDRSPQFGPSLDFDLLPDFFNRIGQKPPNRDRYVTSA